MTTFTYVKAIQMQRKHFEINSCNNEAHIAALGNQPQIPIGEIDNQNTPIKANTPK